jgi:hypothetical protein
MNSNNQMKAKYEKYKTKYMNEVGIRQYTLSGGGILDVYNKFSNLYEEFKQCYQHFDARLIKHGKPNALLEDS